MPGVMWTRFASIFGSLVLSALLSGTAQAQVRLDLPPQSLAQALTSLGSLANLNIYFDPTVVDGHQAPALKADLSVDEALSRLLAGTDLRAIRVDENTVRVVTADKRAQSARAPNTGAVYTPPSMHLAYAGDNHAIAAEPRLAAAGPSTDSTDVADASGSRRGLDEVVVSAEKRAERLQDVPVPVTAVNTDSLIANSQVRLQDYYTQVPGLNVAPMGIQSAQLLSIRGITTGGGSNPTVGITVDDVPYGSSTNLGGGTVVPDIDPGDLAQVEVLRGPQGTLYGASSMGGLIKFVTTDPSTDAFSGRVEGGIGGVKNGAEVGYNMRASVNIPVSDSIAFRASAFTRQDPGYIDNPVRDIRGINEDHASGGRVSALWRPSEQFTLKLSALVQETKADGSSDVDIQPGLGDLQQNYIPGVGGYDRKIQAYSATITAKLGSIDLTSITGYNINSYSDSWDYTYALGALTGAVFGVTGTPITDSNSTRKFNQEIRLTGTITQSVDWLLAGFYTHEDSSYSDAYLAEDPVTGQLSGQGLAISFPTTYQEYAGFADLTFHLTDQFDVQLGGRESEIRQSFKETETGPYDEIFFKAPSPVVVPEEGSKANAFTYLLTPRLKLSPDFMVYARLASGYRAGGTNAIEPGSPSQYNPDKTDNYELGTKADFLDHVLSLDASLYYIAWKDIQLQLLNATTGQTYTTNAGRAKSQGIELSLNSRPIQGLTLGAWISWNDAVLTQALPSTSTAYGASGDRLPFSSRFSGNVNFQDDFPLGREMTGFVGGTVSYVGAREGVFGTSLAPQRQDYPAYAKTDLRAGFVYSSWTTNLFVTNVTDRRAPLSGGIGSFPPFAFTYIQPRAYGLNVSKRF